MQDAPVRISGTNNVVERKCVGVMKWYIQMPMWDMGSVSRTLGVSAWGHGNPSERLGAPLCGSQQVYGWVTLWHRSRKDANCGIEDNPTRYGQEKKKLWVNVTVSVRLPVFVSHIPTQALTPTRIKKVIFLQPSFMVPPLILFFLIMSTHHRDPLPSPNTNRIQKKKRNYKIGHYIHCKECNYNWIVVWEK